MKRVRVRRWILPVTGMTAAVAAVLALVGTEVFLDSERAPAPRAHVASVKAAALPARAVLRPRPAVEVAPQPAAPARRDEPVSGARQIVLPPIPTSRVPVHETPKVLAATNVLSELAVAKTLQERLKIVDDMKARLRSDEAVLKLEGLLDSSLPGTFYEAETLRLYLLARLGELPGPSAEAALVSRIGPASPRPERLIAIDMLAARPSAGRSELTMIAQSDQDTVVQDKARWALAQAQ